MTAEEARDLVKKKSEINPDAVAAWQQSWEHAIRKAAEAGRNSVMDREIDKPRCMVSRAEMNMALDNLRSNGFAIELSCGTITVSW